MEIEMLANRDVLVHLPITRMITQKGDIKYCLTYQEALDLLDKLEKEVWDRPTHKEMEEQIDQLEYELSISRGLLDDLRENGNEKYRDW